MNTAQRLNLIAIDKDEVLFPHKATAERIGVTPKALYDILYDGKWKPKVVKNGRRRLYPLSEILLYMRKNMVQEG